MKISAWLVSVYALIILVGGVIGYSQAQSLPSLIVGVISSLLLLVCALGMHNRSTLAYTMAMAIILALTLFFGYRFALTAKLMPGGMMLLMSAFVLVTILCRRKRKAKLI